MTRFDHHPALGPDTAGQVDFIVDGRTITAREGDSVAVALWDAGRKVLRRSRTGSPRGMYCGIGHCFECRMAVVEPDGAVTDVRSCLTPVIQGMKVETLADLDRRSLSDSADERPGEDGR